jgi:hypothetical protein
MGETRIKREFKYEELNVGSEGRVVMTVGWRSRDLVLSVYDENACGCDRKSNLWVYVH